MSVVTFSAIVYAPDPIPIIGILGQSREDGPAIRRSEKPLDLVQHVDAIRQQQHIGDKLRGHS